MFQREFKRNAFLLRLTSYDKKGVRKDAFEMM